MQFTLFSDSEVKSPKEVIFHSTPLGKLRQVLPLSQLAALLPEKKSKSGAKSWLNNEGQVALMFLKSYTGLSDQCLIDNLNSNWEMQMFCGIQLSVFDRIKDSNLPSSIRCKLGRHLDLEQFQRICISEWKSEMSNQNVCMTDAVVYESYIKYPTDVKLLWDCNEWLFEGLFNLCEYLKIRKPRSQYSKQAEKQKVFAKRKRKSQRENRRRVKQLLKLLAKGLEQIQLAINKYYALLKSSPLTENILSTSFFNRLKTIKTIYTQQKYMSDHPGKKAPDRIVSLAKPWIRAIVRGKENKPVEFGPKIHMSQTDGINYVENYTYKPFNECKRTKISILKHRHIYQKCTHYAGDKIYATNENRRYLTQNRIYSNFSQKGKVRAEEAPQLKIVRSELGKQRATVLEGSFGNEKNHYSLNKIKARLENTEKIWVYFGVMTANAVKISTRKEAKKKLSIAA